MKYLIGNWKANKTSKEVEIWFSTIAKLFQQNKFVKPDDLEIVVCPSFIYLSQAYKLNNEFNLPIKLGAQNISPFEMGSWTGELASLQLAEFVKYVIIGHSERRKNFHEDDQMLKEKVSQAVKANLQIIYCVPDEKTYIPDGVNLVAYEPVWAIGSGTAETPEKASQVGSHIKQNANVKSVIYGGSVKPGNINNYFNVKGIDGVLPGGASLDAISFWEMITHVTSD